MCDNSHLNLRIVISISKAISLVNQSTAALPATKIELSKSLGRPLSSPAVAEIDLPPFDQSAMDGYALKLGNSNSFKVIGMIQAGDDASNVVLRTGEAIKIFTGAMCPANADLVCRIEDIEEEKETIIVHKLPKTGANIRLKGEQIQSGEIGLPKGTILNPASIGFLANLGIQEINTISFPVIHLVSTGNELMPPNNESSLKPGKIFESNGIMLEAALNESGWNPSASIHLNDTYEAVLTGLETCLSNADVTIISGGISVGDYDFVGKALKALGVTEIFYKVNQKPGKPLFFGVKDRKLIFALPGNPAAALTCFYVYVLPALNKLSGKGFKELPRKKSKLTTNITKANSREQLLKAFYENDKTHILEGQSSAMLRSFSEANALAHIPANTLLNAGDEVDIILLR